MGQPSADPAFASFPRSNKMSSRFSCCLCFFLFFYFLSKKIYNEPSHISFFFFSILKAIDSNWPNCRISANSAEILQIRLKFRRTGSKFETNNFQGAVRLVKGPDQIIRKIRTKHCFRVVPPYLSFLFLLTSLFSSSPCSFFFSFIHCSATRRERPQSTDSAHSIIHVQNCVPVSISIKLSDNIRSQKCYCTYHWNRHSFLTKQILNKISK